MHSRRPISQRERETARERERYMDKQDKFADQKVINETARAYLASTDWYAVRAAEGGTAMPSDVKTKRAAERAKVVDYADFSG